MKKFDTYSIGFFHIDLAEVETAEGKLYLFGHRPYLEVHYGRARRKSDMRAAAAFLETLVEVLYHAG